MWISTHTSGPNKYSQFIYQIIECSDGTSWLEFNALHIEHKSGLSEESLQELTAELCRGDAENWRLFAMAMEKDLVK